jgi:hypothetical protein
MELIELKALMAASVLPHIPRKSVDIRQTEVEQAVIIAQWIWEEALKQG